MQLSITRNAWSGLSSVALLLSIHADQEWTESKSTAFVCRLLQVLTLKSVSVQVLDNRDRDDPDDVFEDADKCATVCVAKLCELAFNVDDFVNGAANEKGEVTRRYVQEMVNELEPSCHATNRGRVSGVDVAWFSQEHLQCLCCWYIESSLYATKDIIPTTPRLAKLFQLCRSLQGLFKFLRA